uniref:Saposin B-type domain-containing protein n=1 Tax=Meloidogyne hapla TaxID=6305 RepID=A0A1I8BK81_MELHA
MLITGKSEELIIKDDEYYSIWNEIKVPDHVNIYNTSKALYLKRQQRVKEAMELMLAAQKELLASTELFKSTRTNMMLSKNVIPCAFCQESLEIMKDESYQMQSNFYLQMIEPIAGFLSIFKLGCESRQSCITYFNNVEDGVNGIMKGIKNITTVNDVCENILKCKNG